MTIRTVLGDIDPGLLGICDAHDHLFLSSAALPGQERDSYGTASDELARFAAGGGKSVVQWTPWGMNRRLDDLRKLSSESGVHIVAATGMHRAEHYRNGAIAAVHDRLHALFVDELRTAGLIKVAGAFHELDEHARHVMTAAASAHHVTGAPIGVHLEGGTAAPDVLEFLCGRHAVPPSSVLLGHPGRFPDPALQAEAARGGAYLVFDGPSRRHHGTDPFLLRDIATLAEEGHGRQILLGGDAVTPGTPGMPFLVRNLLPRIRRELGRELADAIFVGNPARAFSFRESVQAPR